MKMTLVLCSAHLLGCFSPQLRADPPPPDGNAVQYASWDQPLLEEARSAFLVKLLQTESRLADVVQQASQSKPKNGHEATYNFYVFTRAGMPEEAKQAVLDLKRLYPILDSTRIESLYQAADESFPTRDLKWVILELFADNLGYSEYLLLQLLDHRLQSGWTVERVDKWLATRQDNTERKWFWARYQFNEKQERVRAFEQELAAGVRQHPDDIPGAIDFLSLLSRIPLPEGESRDLAWFGEIVHPKSALDAYKIAYVLEELQLPQMAAKYYRLAIDTPLTDEDVDGMERGGQGGERADNAVIRARFEVQTREQLAECLQGQGQLEEARKWINEAAKIRQQHDLGEQSATVRGLTTEQQLSEILAAEQTQGGAPEYWIDRGSHFHSENDSAKAEHAFQTGLSLAPPKPDRGGKGNVEIRHQLLYLYVSFLEHEKRLEDVDDLLWKELKQSPAMSASCGFAVSRLLDRRNKQQLTVDHATVLWTWLGNRSSWNNDGEGKVLETLLRIGSPNEIEQALLRAEKLSLNIDPSRALVLGVVENKLAFPERSIPLLEYAVLATPGKGLKVRALQVLIDSYLDINDWEHADSAIQEIGQLYPDDVYTDGVALPEWLTRAAVMAAKAGDKVAAMRYWRKVANLNLTDTGPVAALDSAGLKRELITLYSEMQQSLPTSEVPPRVLKSLQ